MLAKDRRLAGRTTVGRGRPVLSGRLVSLARGEWTAALLVGILALALHAPFSADVPANWDSAQFALGVERFDVVAHQPHPPGYPLYIAAARVFAGLTGDANAALVLLSVVGGAVAPALLVPLARRWSGSVAAGVVAGLLFAVSPLTWYYGAVGLTYAVEAALGLAVVLLGWEVVSRRQPRSPVPAACALALAGGVRPSTLLFLLPLFVYALARVGWRERLAAMVTLAVGVLAWGVPLLVASGGVEPYLAASARLGAIAGGNSSLLARGPAALVDNAAFAGAAAGFGLNAVLALAPALLLRRSRPSVGAGRWLFLAIWAAPALLFFLTVHIGQAGYLLLILPAAYVVAGAVVVRLASGSVVRLTALTVVLAAVSAGAFLVSPNDLSAPYLGEHRRYWRGVAEIVRASPPQSTVVLTGERAWEGFRLAEHALPEYDVRAVGAPIALGGGPAGPSGEVYRTRFHRSTYASFLDGAPARPILVFDPPVTTVFVLDDSAEARLPGADGCVRVPLTERRGVWRCTLGEPIAEMRLIAVR